MRRSGSPTYGCCMAPGDHVMLEADGLVKIFGQGAAEVDALRGVDLVSRTASSSRSWARRARARARCCTSSAALDRPTAGSVVDRRPPLRRPRRSRAHATARRGVRLRLPVLQPAADAHGRRERAAAGAGRRRAAEHVRRSASTSCSRWSGSAIAPATCRPRCPAASSSEWRSPGRCCAGREVLLADEPTGNLDSRQRRERPRAAAPPRRRRSDRGDGHARRGRRGARRSRRVPA